MILAGDIGGTKTNLAIFEKNPGGLALREEASFPSRDNSSLEEIARAFLTTTGRRPSIACFGVAGPVIDGRCRTTNLPWLVDRAELSRVLGIARVLVINDLEATAFGVPLVEREKTVVLNEGAEKARGNAAVIAAGTGLGEAGMFWDGARHIPFACEGGHTAFAPRDALEARLRRHLSKHHDRVSWERLVSGPGLKTIYEFLRSEAESQGRHDAHEQKIQDAIEAGDAPAVIAEAALEDRSELCSRALDLFVSLYGAEAGDLALKMLATGGIWVAGGIAPKILERLEAGPFMEAFLAKGRMRPLMERIPVRVVLAENAALLGAARCAWLHAPHDAH